MKSVGFHFQRSGASSPSVPTLSTTRWLNTEATQMVLKSANGNSVFQKTLQTKNEVNPEPFTRE